MILQTPFWSSFLGQLCIELIGGTFGAFIFLFLVLLLFRPKVKLCPFVCESTDSVGRFYRFKIVNLSMFSAHDIEIQLFKMRKVPMGSGFINNKYEEINLRQPKISHLPRRTTRLGKDVHNNHCLVIRCRENLNEILEQEIEGIMLKISLKHGLTGLARVTEMEYWNVEDIKSGKFTPGTKFGIM